MDVHKAIKFLSTKDEAMATLIARLGTIELPTPRSDFHTLVEAIISQQVSTKAAATIHARLQRLAANDVSPGRILDMGTEELRSVGLSGQKSTYLHALASAFAKNAETYSRLHEMEDSEVIASLTEIKGIGLWTAQMFLIFTLLREDVFPIDDLAIRKGMERFVFTNDEGVLSETLAPTRKDMIARAELWAPYRSVASLYLWKGLDPPTAV